MNLFEETDEIIAEPEGSFTYGGIDYPFWGNPNGRARTVEYEVGKFNRYVKMGMIADELVNKFEHSVTSDSGIKGHCAFACLIMMKYGVRIGNEDSASGYESGQEDNKGEIVQTYGTTTLLNKHISFEENKLRLKFLGKEQVSQDIVIDDPFIVNYGKKLHNAAELDAKWLGIDYDILFKYVKQEVGDAFIPKDFRTFCANVTGWRTIEKLLDAPMRKNKTEAKKDVKFVVETVAARLGNTPGISKRNYIDSRMLDWFVDQRYSKIDE